MTSSHRSDFVRIRGLRHHIRIIGHDDRPPLWLLPGWLDTSATWVPVAEVLAEHWQVHTPDWRGIGHTEWPQDGYWFYDYVADLDAMLAHYLPGEPLRLVGHSMGAQVASLYAGLKPERVQRLALLDGLFLPDMEPKLAPKRFRGWLDEVRTPPPPKTYSSFEVLAQRIKKQHPQLSDEKALFVARGWAYADGHGQVRLLADPKHYWRGPALYKAAESKEIWRCVTAPTLFLDAGLSPFGKAISSEETGQRRACFRDRREERIEGAGHMLHFDAPEETARAIVRFMNDST